MADNTNLPAASGKAATDEVSYSGDTAVVQLVRNVAVTGSEGSKTVVENMPASLGQKAKAASFPVTLASDSDAVSISGNVGILGLDNQPHGDPDAGNPQKIGGKYVASPTGVTDGDRTNFIADQFGQQRVVIGDPSDAAEVAGVAGSALSVRLAAHALGGTGIPVRMVDAGGDALDPLPVSGPLTDTQLRATAVPVSGTVTANAGTGTLAVSAASLPLPTGAATAAKQPALGTAGTSSADVLTVQGRASMTPLLVDGSATTQPISGTVTANVGTGTQAVSGTVAVTGVATETTLAAASAKLPAALAAGGGLKVEGVAGGVAQPISGTVTANAGTNLNTSNLATEVGGNLAGVYAATAVIAGPVATLGTDTYTEATTKGNIVGAVRRDADTTLVNTTNEIGPLQMDVNGRLKVEAFSGETLPVSLASTTVTGTVAVTQSGTWDEVGINDSGNSITVDGTFWQATQPVSIATAPALVASSANIGDVDILTVPSPLSTAGAGTAAAAHRTTLASDDPAVVSLQLLDDVVFAEDAVAASGDKGIPLLAVRRDTAATSTSTDGDWSHLSTDNLGALWVSTRGNALVTGNIVHDASDDSSGPVKIGSRAASALPTAVATDDRANAISDLFGRLLVSHIDPAMQVTKIYNDTSSRAAASAVSVWDPTSGKRIAITSLIISTYGTTAGRIFLFFADDADLTYSAGTDQALFVGSFAPSATAKPGMAIAYSVPVMCTTANRRLHYQNDAAISVDFTIVGYEF